MKILGEVFDMVLGFLAGLFGGAATTFLNSVQIRTQRATFNMDPVGLLNTAAYADAYRLGVISKKDYYSYMRESGYSSNQAKLHYHTMRDWMSMEQAGVQRIAKSLEDVLKWYESNPNRDYKYDRLDKIKEEYTKAMYRNGYGQTESARIFKTLRPVPSFSILLEWLAKEAFEPKIVKRFGLDEDYPKIWQSLMSALGVPSGEAKNYWVAHWNHLAIGQIANVFQRFRSDRTDYSEADLKNAGTTFDDVKMSKDDFTEALKIHEIAPFWHDRYIASSYMPLTLSSLQQGYQYALKDDDWFLGRLKDYGYSADNAEFILDVWRRKYPYGGKAPLDDNPLLRMRRGEITKAQAKKLLTDAKVPEEAAEFVTQLTQDQLDIELWMANEKATRASYSRLNLSKQSFEYAVKLTGTSAARAARLAEVYEAYNKGLKKGIRLRDAVYGFKNGRITEQEFMTLTSYLHITPFMKTELVKIYKPIKLETNKDKASGGAAGGIGQGSS